MVLLKKITIALLKLIILLLLITFEKIIGLPTIFIVTFLVFFANEEGSYKYIYLVMSSIFIALTYNFSFAFSLLLLIYLVFATKYADNFISSDVVRGSAVIYSLLLIIALFSKLSFGLGIFVYFILSSLLSLGILMNTFKDSGENSNFFK